MPLIKQTLKIQLQDDLKSVLKEAFEEAFKDSVLGKQDSNSKKVIDKMAKNFSDTASRIVSQKLSGKLADAIDSYIKSASITITGAPQAALVCGVGPVSGVVNIPPTFVTIS
jgi:hypothetical protein